MSWRGIKRLLLGLSLFYGMIAALLAWQGALLVAPFTGLEVLALCLAFYLNALSGSRREVITVTADRLRIERGCRRPQRQLTLHPYWARVLLEEDPRSRGRSRLLLRSHGDSVEIGAALHQHERVALARELRATLTELGRSYVDGRQGSVEDEISAGTGGGYPGGRKVAAT